MFSESPLIHPQYLCCLFIDAGWYQFYSTLHHCLTSSFQVEIFLTLSLDFPGEVSGRSAAEQASPLLWKNRTKRRRASHPGEIYNEQGASEADIDSDSGYCSPKHNQVAGVTQRTAENTAAPTVSRLLSISSRRNRLIVNCRICFNS